MRKQITVFLILFIMFAHAFSQPSPRVALVLSGGGALGYAHIGVLQALDEAGIKPSIIAGTSMGAIVGAVYAQGYTGNELFEFVKQRRLYSLHRNVHVSFLHVNRGLGSYKHVRQLLNDAIPHDRFDSLDIPFLCVATNIRTGRPEVRSMGADLADWVLASASIPVIFKPQLIDGEYYCDGGFVDNLPSSYLPKESYDICIGIDLVPQNAPLSEDYFSRDYMVSDVYGNMILDINSHEGRTHCDYIIRPHSDVAYGILDFRHYDELRQRGYEAMKQWLTTNAEVIRSK